MIAIRINGRLGNQLFQYAFVYSTAKTLNTSFYIDQHDERFIADKYFKNLSTTTKLISPLFTITGFKNFFTFYLRRYYYSTLAKIWGLNLNPNNSLTYFDVLPQNHSLYLGYFQSERFFIKHEKLIRNKFTLRNNFIEEFNSRYSKLYKNNKVVVIHIRRTDYADLSHLNLGGDDLSLPVAYYKNAIAKYKNQKVCFVFISDDRDFVVENFKDVTDKIVSTDSEIMDFQHLLNADGCIIANSTFSWWGAWLNNKPGKVIYVPKYFMGWLIKKETPEKIYPKAWIQIDF